MSRWKGDKTATEGHGKTDRRYGTGWADRARTSKRTKRGKAAPDGPAEPQVH